MGTVSKPASAEVTLTLEKRIHNIPSRKNRSNELLEKDIDSPKSVIFLEKKGKFYVNSLEGFKTVVFNMSNFKKIKSIPHSFTAKDAHLFKETTSLNYTFLVKRKAPNVFKGKPVEFCLTHKGKYLWVTYYRRNYDKNAVEPSAMAVIDTDIDKIVRVIPTGLLPKMMAATSDGKYLAVTHWGDNTIGILDISSSDVKDFKFIKHFKIGRQLKYKAKHRKGFINRDRACGHCLRGTMFTPDNKYLLVGRMGNWGTVFIDIENMKYIGTVWGMKEKVRHIEVTDKYLYMNSIKTGVIQKTSLNNFISHSLDKKKIYKNYLNWRSVYLGRSPRTFKISKDGRYLFAAVYSSGMIIVIRTSDMKKIARIGADFYPVGLALSDNGKRLITTSQSRGGKLGQAVNIYKVEYSK